MVDTAKSESQLPAPEQRPGAEIVIFDGDCRFCRRHVERFARWDRQGRLAFLSLHDPRVSQWFPDLDREGLMRHMVIVDRRGRRHRGAGAIRHLSRHLRPLWPLAPLLHLPGTLPLWQWAYGQIARRRYRFGQLGQCTNGSCRVRPQ